MYSDMYSAVETLIKVLRNYHQLKVLFTFVERRYTDFSPHSQFAPFFSETFRPQLIIRKDVSPPPHKLERRFAPVFIVQ